MIWIRTSGNYWYNAWDKKPYESSEIKSIITNFIYYDFVIILINSSLFYFWLRIYGDGRHLNLDILKQFQVPSKDIIQKYNYLLNKIRERFINKLFFVFDKEHRRFISSRIKDEIDILYLFIGKFLYNLNYKEIMYILNYDSSIRTGIKLPNIWLKVIKNALIKNREKKYKK